MEDGDRLGLQEIIDRSGDGAPTAEGLVLTVVREAILGGVLKPGTRLRQEDLAEIFATSRVPVRDALRALEYEGLVESAPHRGSTVRELDIDEIDEIYDLRILLESHALRLVIPLLTDEDHDALRTLLTEMEAATDPDTQLARREQLYLRLYSVSGRPRLVGLIMRLRQEVARILRWKLIPQSPAHHRAFLEMVLDGQQESAVEHLAAHYRRVAALLRRSLREGKSHDMSPLLGPASRMRRRHQ